ncbi:hypothetical protein CRUP_011776 [Coryphaenoides rupestris]|nr:hypothetical protein CRUP_011776 [Coryphaenoides rupestris]
MNMGKITFYEDRNFQGRSYECMSDCSDMSSYLSRCQSCRVESGCFMVYERNNYMGQQYFMRRGEYPDMQHMMSMGMTFDNFRSCRMIPYHRGQFRMKIYERENYGGQFHEMMDDCDNIQDRYRMSDCQSCNVMDGHWLMYEQPQYRGRMMYMRPGEYRSFRDMGMSGQRFMSMRRITDISDCSDMSSYLSRCHSCRVESGCFMAYDRTNYMGNQFFMRRGEYSDYHQMNGFNDCIRSCRMIPMHRGSYRARIYEKENFGGQFHEMTDDCDNFQDRYRMSDCQSCNVMDGHWLMYEQPQYRGRMMYMRPGEYRSFRDMGMSGQRILTAMDFFQIIFYEDKNFQGRSYEASSDCSDMSSYLSRCHSCRVESGCFMAYDRTNYMGNQYFMRRGEYSDYHQMNGFNDCIRSCRMIPMHRGSYRARIYEKENFGGQFHEMTDDCDNFQDRYRMSDCQSCNVMDGHWLMYEQPQYRGRMMYMRPGEYRSFRDMGMSGQRFMSMRRIMDSYY